MCCITNTFGCFKAIQINDIKTKKRKKIIILTFGKSIFITRKNNKIKMRKFREGWKIDVFQDEQKMLINMKCGILQAFSGETVKFAGNVLRIYGEPRVPNLVYCKFF
jgi:hypothetical protein